MCDFERICKFYYLKWLIVNVKVFLVRQNKHPFFESFSGLLCAKIKKDCEKRLKRPKDLKGHEETLRIDKIFSAKKWRNRNSDGRLLWVQWRNFQPSSSNPRKIVITPKIHVYVVLFRQKQFFLKQGFELVNFTN